MADVKYTGRPAAALVGVITILIIFYIIILPPETRESLLDDKNLTENGESEAAEETLIETNIGKLTYIQDEVINHYIPGAYLEEKEEASILAEYDTFTVSKGLFGGDEVKKTFSIPELEKTNTVKLAFQTPIHAGKLKITLNGKTIIEEEISTTLPKPITLQKQYLQKNNELIFEVFGGFLKDKEYKITDLIIIGTVSEDDKMSAEHYFTIPGAEMENFKNAYLEFRTVCLQREVGKLNIELNGRTISSTTPACDNLNRIDVFKEDLNLGKNEIMFKLSEGKARIESAKIKTNMKEQKGYTNFFTIEEKDWDKITEDEKKIIMDLEFIDDDYKKKLEVSVNGRRNVVDQREPHYTKDITRYVKAGNNYIQLQPLTEVTIAALEVRIEDV